MRILNFCHDEGFLLFFFPFIGGLKMNTCVLWPLRNISTKLHQIRFKTFGVMLQTNRQTNRRGNINHLLVGEVISSITWHKTPLGLSCFHWWMRGRAIDASNSRIAVPSLYQRYKGQCKSAGCKESLCLMLTVSTHVLCKGGDTLSVTPNSALFSWIRFNNFC